MAKAFDIRKALMLLNFQLKRFFLISEGTNHYCSARRHRSFRGHRHSHVHADFSKTIISSQRRSRYDRQQGNRITF